jgi:mRNA-degrading endonuclease toxin of MazEF toxin-antitoxin module
MMPVYHFRFYFATEIVQLAEREPIRLLRSQFLFRDQALHEFGPSILLIARPHSGAVQHERALRNGPGSRSWTLLMVVRVLVTTSSELRNWPVDAGRGTLLTGRLTVGLTVDYPVSVSKAHLGRRAAMLSSERLKEICASLAFTLGCI